MKKTNKCANLYAIGDLKIEEKPLPVCKEDEVLVEIKACGILQKHVLNGEVR